MPAMAGHSSGGAVGSTSASSGACSSGSRSAGGADTDASLAAAAVSPLRAVSASVGGAPWKPAGASTAPPTTAGTTATTTVAAAGGGGGTASSSPRAAGSDERMYNAKQLTEALKSGLAAVKEQLQVLAILDGTALSWPGVSQAVDDLDFLTDMVSQTTNRLEGASRALQVQLEEAVADAATLRDSLAAATSRRDDLTRQLTGVHRELREARVATDEARREAQQVRQELWSVEKQRADTASELDRAKQEVEEMAAEMRELRVTNSSQAASLGSLKEELAARRADVGHLKQLTAEVRSANNQLRQQLAGAQEAAAAAQGSLQHLRSEKQHYEREVGRLGEECSRLGAELDRTSRELGRLREWQDVLKKVEADKLREEQEAHGRTRSEAEARAAEADKREALLRADVRAREDRLAGRDAELDTQRKANGLLQLQVKDLQKQLSMCQGERTAAATARDDQRTTVAKLQSEIQRMRLEWAQREKERVVAESAAREAAAADKAKLQAQLEEAGREAALARTLSDSWQRELREARSRSGALGKELETVRSQLSEGKVEHVRSGAAAEGQVVALRAQLAAREEELRRVKLDAAAAQKQMDKAVERLQREVDASAAEVARLKGVEDAALFTRLPPVPQHRAATIHEELEALRKALRDRMAGGAPAGGAGGGGGGYGASHAPQSAPAADSYSPLSSPSAAAGGPGPSLPALVMGSVGLGPGAAANAGYGGGYNGGYNGVGGGGGAGGMVAVGGGSGGSIERQAHLRNRTR